MRRWLLLLPLVACSSPTVIEVTLSAREGVGDIDELIVDVRNESDRVSARFDVAGRSFPLTFTVTPEGRSGFLTLNVTAIDALDTTVAVADATVMIAADNAVDVATQLEPSDFVLNSVVDGAQRTAFRNGRNGRALAELDGGFVVTFVNDCISSACDVFVRSFDANGQPRPLLGSTAEVTVNTAEEPRVSVPAVATNSSGEIGIVWETDDAVRFSRIDATGALATTDLKVTADTVENPSDPAILGLTTGFQLNWYQENDTPLPAGIHRATVANGAVGAITTVQGESAARTVALAGDEAAIATVWAEPESLVAAVAPLGQNGTPTAVATFTSEFLAATQVVALNSGFVVSYGRQSGGQSAGLMLTRLDAAGGHVRDVVLAANSDRATDRPSIAVDDEDRIAVTWTACEEEGEPDGDRCGILFALFDADLSPITQPRVVNTTRADDQFDPAVVATQTGFVVVWTDNSGAPPDPSISVRGRVIYIDTLL